MTIEPPGRIAPPGTPLEIRESGDGWTVTCYRTDGHVRHVAHADTEIGAYRIAHSFIHLYGLTGTARISTSRGVASRNIERLMHRQGHDPQTPPNH